MKTHYRLVTFEIHPFTGKRVTSLKIPCGNPEARITRDSTKEEARVDCKRCRDFLAKRKTK